MKNTLPYEVLEQAGLHGFARFLSLHPDPSTLASMLTQLQQTKLLTEEYLHLLVSHPNSKALAKALSHLHKSAMLTKQHLNLILQHPQPNFLASALVCLHRSDLLTEANCLNLLNHSEILCLADALYYLQNAGILNQENLDALFAPGHQALITPESRHLVWQNLTKRHLTQVNFQRLLSAAAHDNPSLELTRVIQQIHGRTPRFHPSITLFNPIQSRHTESIHRSVSISAIKLMQSYGHTLELEARLAEIKTYILSLSDCPKHQAAKRCISRITAHDYYYIDSSGISIQQLLALCFIAIHDDHKRLGKLEDAKNLFVDGLYEIQRGYNIEYGHGPEIGEDNFLCIGGTFNKLIEQLNGIHHDVELVYVNHAGASAKFLKLAQTVALHYLENQSSPASSHDYDSVNTLIKQLKSEGSLEPIWNRIKDKVAACLWDEFSEAYSGNPSDERFLALMESGSYIELPNLSTIETRLRSSPGFKAYDAQKLISNLWAQRFSSAKTQHDFDSVCGLILYQPAIEDTLHG